MRVLLDAIHADLLESLRLLSGRLGWEMYTPIGMEWYEAGIWRFERERLGDQVAKQFLTPWPDDEYWLDSGCSVRRPASHPKTTIRMVTMEQARALKPDVIISTLAENDLGWATFAREVGAHFGVQVGNQGAEVQWGAAEFALLSVTTPGFTPWKPHVYYRQEFSLTDFAADGGAGADAEPWVMTRVQCATQTPEHAMFRELAERTGLKWTWHGHCGEPDEHYGGNAHTTAEVAAEMHRARIAWHAKRWSDGYGHVIHNWAAIGRPMLVTADYYADKLAAPLFVEGKTSFNLEKHSVNELQAIVMRLAVDDDYWRRICQDTAIRFREVVDFDAEAEAIRTMMDKVLSDPAPR